jgi:hypothetical protein
MTMSKDEGPVFVMIGATANANRVYHRDFPEIRADGETPAIAATHLVNHLTRALDSALTHWRRESLTQAVADVQKFVGQRA